MLETFTLFAATAAAATPPAQGFSLPGLGPVDLSTANLIFTAVVGAVGYFLRHKDPFGWHKDKEDDKPADPAPAAPPAVPVPAPPTELGGRVTSLEGKVARVEAKVDNLAAKLPQ